VLSLIHASGTQLKQKSGAFKDRKGSSSAIYFIFGQTLRYSESKEQATRAPEGRVAKPVNMLQTLSEAEGSKQKII
jgi:hypothetical protein